MAIPNAFFNIAYTPPRSAIFNTDYAAGPRFTLYKLCSTLHHRTLRAGTTAFHPKMVSVSCTVHGVDSSSYSLEMEHKESLDVPTPIVQIVQDPESDETRVELSFGDRLGALIDTMKALNDLGLDVKKGTVTTEGAVKSTKFIITHHNWRKVEDPDLLERIRLTIINNLIKYHPESSQWLAMGEVFGIKAPEKKPDIDVATHIHVENEGTKRSMLYVETADRSGLLMEIIKIMADISVDVESAEIDTEGLIAKDKFYVSYRGAALNNSLSQVLQNVLRYYLQDLKRMKRAISQKRTRTSINL